MKFHDFDISVLIIELCINGLIHNGNFRKITLWRIGVSEKCTKLISLMAPNVSWSHHISIRSLSELYSKFISIKPCSYSSAPRGFLWQGAIAVHKYIFWSWKLTPSIQLQGLCLRKRWRATACCGKSKFAISSRWLNIGSVSHPDDIITLL